MTRSITTIASIICFTLGIGCGADDSIDVESLQQAAKTVYQSTLKGGGASASFGDKLGGGNVDVWESGTGTAAGAFLSYGFFGVDPTSEVCISETYPPKDPTLPPPPPITYCYYTRQIWESGWGSIPTQDVRIGKGTATLSTAVQSGPEFQIERCEWDMLSPMPPTCTSAAGGAIELTFRKDGVQSTKRTGTEQYQSGPYLHKTSGVYTSASATVEGNLLGRALTGAQGYLYSSNGASISREIARP